MGLAKQAIDEGAGRPIGEGLDREARAFVEVFDTEDARLGVAASASTVPERRPSPAADTRPTRSRAVIRARGALR